VLYEPGRPIGAVYFPLSACISRVIVLADGSSLETALIGNEGLVGLPLYLGIPADTAQAIVQVPGTALRLGAADFRAAVAQDPALPPVLGRYTQFCVSQLGLTAACNALHAVEERCARWLLQLQDRVQRAEFPLTQEFLAALLGVRRPSVTLAAGALQRAGLIRYQRGQVTVLDRQGLEAAACECYGTLAAVQDALLPRPGAAPS
jgi:CRP-like cAMP-binding protein